MCYIDDLTFEASRCGFEYTVEDTMRFMNENQEAKIIAQEASNELLLDLIIDDDGGKILATFIKCVLSDDIIHESKAREDLIELVVKSAKEIDFVEEKLEEFICY